MKSSSSLLACFLSLTCAAQSAVVLGNWSSPTGFPTSSDPPGYPFVTAHDEGTGIGDLAIPLTQAFAFSVTNNHPTKTIEVTEVSLTLTGISGAELQFSIGTAPLLTELDDGLVPLTESIFTYTRLSSIDPLWDIGPGETWYAVPILSPGGGGGFNVQNARITGTAIPEPSAICLIALAAIGTLRRKRQA